MSLVQELVREHFSTSEGELAIGGIRVSEIASEFGTPLFVYDRAVLEKKWRVLRDALPERVEIYYSIKANPSPAVLKVFLDLGCGLEIASGGELYQALQAGALPERILFAGPGKRDEELEEFLLAGGGEIHVESVGEARRLSALCERLDRRVSVAVRVNPSGEVQGGAMRMGGKSAAFGVDEESMDEVVDALLASDRIRVGGVHIFAGTQILDAAVLGAQYRKCVEIARRIAARVGSPLATVDFGGGLGIPYFDGDAPLDAAAYGAAVRDVLETLDDEAFHGTRFIVEPGRYLAGEAGVYVTRVTDVKISRGKTYAVLDGGMNHHLAASGNLGQVIKRNFPIAVVDRIEAPASEKVEVVGPLCTPLDTLGRAVDLAPVEPGNLVGIFQAGAYARTASPLGFLSHVTPPEVMVSAGGARRIRRRGSYRELLDDCRELHS